MYYLARKICQSLNIPLVTQVLTSIILLTQSQWVISEWNLVWRYSGCVVMSPWESRSTALCPLLDLHVVVVWRCFKSMSGLTRLGCSSDVLWLLFGFHHNTTVKLSIEKYCVGMTRRRKGGPDLVL